MSPLSLEVILKSIWTVLKWFFFFLTIVFLGLNYSFFFLFLYSSLSLCAPLLLHSTSAFSLLPFPPTMPSEKRDSVCRERFGLWLGKSYVNECFFFLNSGPPLKKKKKNSVCFSTWLQMCWCCLTILLRKLPPRNSHTGSEWFLENIKR